MHTYKSTVDAKTHGLITKFRRRVTVVPTSLQYTRHDLTNKTKAQVLQEHSRRHICLTRVLDLWSKIRPWHWEEEVAPRFLSFDLQTQQLDHFFVFRWSFDLASGILVVEQS